MWTSPSCLTPTSTNAPKSVTFLTVPVRIIPSRKSSKDNTSDLKIGLGMSSLGSLPGLINSFIMSFKVGSPMLNLLANVLMSFSLLTSDSLAFTSFIFSLSIKSFVSNPNSFNRFLATS